MRWKFTNFWFIWISEKSFSHAIECQRQRLRETEQSGKSKHLRLCCAQSFCIYLRLKFSKCFVFGRTNAMPCWRWRHIIKNFVFAHVITDCRRQMPEKTTNAAVHLKWNCPSATRPNYAEARTTDWHSNGHGFSLSLHFAGLFYFSAHFGNGRRSIIIQITVHSHHIIAK